MSHIVSVSTKIRDSVAVTAACQRLGLPQPVQGTAELFSGEATGCWCSSRAGSTPRSSTHLRAPSVTTTSAADGANRLRWTSSCRATLSKPRNWQPEGRACKSANRPFRTAASNSTSSKEGQHEHSAPPSCPARPGAGHPINNAITRSRSCAFAWSKNAVSWPDG